MSRPTRPLPSKEKLWEMLDYNPETGVLTWKLRGPLTRRFAGKAAGCLCKATGYVILNYDGFPVRAHRVIFKMMTGREPPQIDHRDRCRANNRWVNLREATQKDNQGNRQGRPNRSLPKGVGLVSGGRYRAFITIAGKYKHLGRFGDPASASAAYQAAALDYFGEFFQPT